MFYLIFNNVLQELFADFDFNIEIIYIMKRKYNNNLKLFQGQRTYYYQDIRQVSLVRCKTNGVVALNILSVNSFSVKRKGKTSLRKFTC